jgi:NADH-quinone oxidoreductase subunit G
VTRITINGRELEADPKKPLIHACHQHGVDVPMYCYHPGLSPVGSCRICQVEVKQGEAPARVVVACRTPVAEGMVVNTEAPKAHDARRECLEFLLKNHPLDCPICDKAGECDLQDYAFNEGQGEGRSREPRRRLEKRVSLGDVILLDQERCILCSRCVRFFEEVTHKPQLTVADLGSRSVITTFMDRPLTGNYQGNLADICPVGALTSKQFRFQARVWNLKKSLSTCAECSRGCSITVEVLRKREVKRFRPRFNPAVNQWWMCDVGRFAFESVNAPDRIQGALRRGYSAWEGCSVEDALAQATDLLLAQPGALVIGSPFLTVEEGAVVKQLAELLGGKPAFVSPPPNGLKDELLHTGDPCPNRRGLVGLGFEALEPELCLERMANARAAVLVGERVSRLLGGAGLAGLAGRTRLVIFDAHAPAPGEAGAGWGELAIGVPIHVEKTGHWLNVDGVRGELQVARPPPAGVELLTRTAQRLCDLLAAASAPTAPMAPMAPMSAGPPASGAPA